MHSYLELLLPIFGLILGAYLGLFWDHIWVYLRTIFGFGFGPLFGLYYDRYFGPCYDRYLVVIMVSTYLGLPRPISLDDFIDICNVSVLQCCECGIIHTLRVNVLVFCVTVRSLINRHCFHSRPSTPLK